MKSSIFASDPPVYNIEVGNSSLLSLFYTIKMNRNFIPVLTQVKWGTSTKFEDMTQKTNPNFYPGILSGELVMVLRIQMMGQVKWGHLVHLLWQHF